MLDLYRRLIALRAAEPDLADPDLLRVAVDYDEDARWLVVHRGAFRVVANLGATEQAVPLAAGEIVLATGSAEALDGTVRLGPESAAIVRLAP
jgi:maltooligosyltrehalose trehalohydrolase